MIESTNLNVKPRGRNKYNMETVPIVLEITEDSERVIGGCVDLFKELGDDTPVENGCHEGVCELPQED